MASGVLEGQQASVRIIPNRSSPESRGLHNPDTDLHSNHEPTSSVATTSGSVVPQAGNELLVLASGSPRRRELLAGLGVCFESLNLAIDERPVPHEEAMAYARRVAREKATAALPLRPGRWILGADTVVEIDGVILGKPSDQSAARTMLARLSGRTHRVITAVTLIGPDGTVQLDDAVVSHVRFRRLSPQDIDDYVRSGEPFDKAGAYAIQGLGGKHVESVEGSHSSVIGLPLELVKEELKTRGLLP